MAQNMLPHWDMFSKRLIPLLVLLVTSACGGGLGGAGLAGALGTGNPAVDGGAGDGTEGDGGTILGDDDGAADAAGGIDGSDSWDLDSGAAGSGTGGDIYAYNGGSYGGNGSSGGATGSNGGSSGYDWGAANSGGSGSSCDSGYTDSGSGISIPVTTARLEMGNSGTEEEARYYRTSNTSSSRRSRRPTRPDLSLPRDLADKKFGQPVAVADVAFERNEKGEVMVMDAVSGAHKVVVSHLSTFLAGEKVGAWHAATISHGEAFVVAEASAKMTHFRVVDGLGVVQAEFETRSTPAAPFAACPEEKCFFYAEKLPWFDGMQVMKFSWDGQGMISRDMVAATPMKIANMAMTADGALWVSGKEDSKPWDVYAMGPGGGAFLSMEGKDGDSDAPASCMMNPPDGSVEDHVLFTDHFADGMVLHQVLDLASDRVFKVAHGAEMGSDVALMGAEIHKPIL